MVSQLNRVFCLFIILTIEVNAQSREIRTIDIDDLSIQDLSILKRNYDPKIDGVYKYLTKEEVVYLLGPGLEKKRMDELMETEMVRLYYGESFIEFYDQSFGEEIPQGKYSLYGVDLKNDLISIKYKEDILKVGNKIPNWVSMNEELKSNYQFGLRRKKLMEISDYVLKIQCTNGIIERIIFIVD